MEYKLPFTGDEIVNKLKSIDDLYDKINNNNNDSNTSNTNCDITGNASGDNIVITDSS